MSEGFKMVATVLGGLALFVYGMGVMSDGLKATAGEKMKAVLGYMTRNRLFAILAGAGVTALVQSSSATSVMTVGFVNAGLLSLEQAIGVIFGANVGTTITGQIVSLKLSDIALPAVTLGVINLWTAVPIVLGDNIGTTVTAALAAIGTNVHAKRTALAHALFNILGTLILVLSFVLVFANASGVSAPAFFHLVDACTAGRGLGGENPGRHVAMAHTLFNITNVLVLAFFIPALARLCTVIIRTKDDTHVRALEPNLLETPSLALQAATNALADMTRRAWTVASVALNSCLGKATVGAEAIEGAEREIDEMQREIRDYLIEVSQRRLTAREAQMIPELIHCVNDAERISDLALKVFRKTSRVKESLGDSNVQQNMARVASQVRSFAHATIRAIRSGGAEELDAKRVEQDIHTSVRAITRAIGADSCGHGTFSREAFAILSVFSCLRDISRHLGNIAVRSPAFR